MQPTIRKPNCNCHVCGKQIYRRPCQINKGNVFCSRKCYVNFSTILIECAVCKTKFKKGLHKKTCSKKCSNELRAGMKYKTGSPTKSKTQIYKRLKEMLVRVRGTSCEKCGYTNTSILNVHHKIRKCDGGTDDLTNLELICPNCHSEQHYGDNKTYN